MRRDQGSAGAAPAGEAAAGLERTRSDAQTPGQSRRLLIVDDDPVLREGLTWIVARLAGFEVCGQAPDGRAALAATGDLKPHIVLMDLRMPRMDGFAATARLARWHPNVPVLIYSAFGGVDNRVRAQRAGAAGFLVKGVSLVTLRDALHAVSRGLGWWREPAAKESKAALPSVSLWKPKEPPMGLLMRERDILEVTLLTCPARR